MHEPLASLPLDQPVSLQFADGVVLRGTLRACGGGWLRLDDPRGRHWVQLAHVAMLSAQAHHADATVPAAAGDALPKPSPSPAPAKGSRAPGRPWPDDDL